MYSTLFLIPLALTFIFSFVLGIFTILNNPKSRIHQLWFLTTIGVSVWSGGLLAVIGLQLNNDLGLLLTRILHVGVVILIIFFYNFLLDFLLKKEKSNKVLLIVGYFLSLIFIILILISNLFVKGLISKMGFDIWLESGKMFWLLIFYFIFYTAISIHILFKEYKNSEGFRKKQIYFILLAVIIGLGGGITIFFPEIFNIYPFGIFLLFVYPLIITYGVFLKKY